jgi:hypothetical protein
MRLRFFLPRNTKFVKLLFLLFGLSACGSQERPDNLIQEDKMAKILAEIHLLEAQINNLRFQHEDSSVYVYQKKRFDIVKSFQSDTATFRISLKYYLLNPDKMKEIYKQVKVNLEAKKKVIEANNKLEEKKKKMMEQKKILPAKKKIKADTTKKTFVPINKIRLKLFPKVTPKIL